MDSFLDSSASRCSIRSTNTRFPQLMTRWPRAMIVLFLTASLGLVSCGSRQLRIDGWKLTRRPPCLVQNSNKTKMYVILMD